MNKYFELDEVTFKKLKSSMLSILIEFDKICKTHGLNYSLSSGTLIGAARHQGFIPWDDDLDVMMLREDYEKFLDVTKHHLHEDFYIVNYMTEKNFINNFTRLCLVNSKLVQGIYKDAGFNQGIFIDIFPLDVITEDDNLLKEQIVKYSKLAWLKEAKIKGPTTNKIKVALKSVFRVVLRPYTTRMINQKMTKLATQFRHEGGSVVDYVTYNSYDRIRKRCLKVENVLNTVPLEFEGYYFEAYDNWNNVLEGEFGDYMQLPPVEERLPTHDIIHLEFDERYTNLEIK